MSVKALKRQLMAAIAMALVAAVALGSSTFAWFVNNNKVSATGMNIQATAEGGIEIKAVSGTQNITASTEWTTSANAQIASTTLYPTSNLANAAYNGVITTDWYHASADKATAYAATGATYAKLQTIEGKCTFGNGVALSDGVLTFTDNVSGAVPAGNYYLATTYHIASIGGTATDLKVEGVTVSNSTDNQANFNSSLRVAVVCGNNICLYAPIGYTANATYKVCTATDGTPIELKTGTMPGSTNATALPSSTTSSQLNGTVGSESDPTVVNVYVWYEGEDSNHYTTNLGTQPDGLAVTVNFVASLGQN